MLNTKPIPDEPEGREPLVCVLVKSNGEIHLMVPSEKLLIVLDAEQALDLGQALLTCGYFAQGMRDANDSASSAH